MSLRHLSQVTPPTCSTSLALSLTRWSQAAWASRFRLCELALAMRCVFTACLYTAETFKVPP